MSVSPVILKFEQSAEEPFGSTRRVVGFVKLRHLAPILTAADLESNPANKEGWTDHRHDHRFVGANTGHLRRQNEGHLDWYRELRPARAATVRT